MPKADWKNKDPPRAATVDQGLEDGGQAGRAQALQPRRTPYTALGTSLWDLEMGICVFLNSSKFQSKFTPARDKRGCGSSLPSKRNKRKQREPHPPSPGRPVDLFPAKMCSGRGGSTFVTAVLLKASKCRSRVLSPKGPTAPGMSPAGFACSAQVYTTCLSGPRASMNAPCPGKHPLPLTESRKCPQ